jgi:hypothetical protein
MTAGGLNRPGCPRGPHVVPAVMGVKTTERRRLRSERRAGRGRPEAWGSLRRALVLERGPLLGRGSWPKTELPCLPPQGEGVRVEPGSAPRDRP